MERESEFLEWVERRQQHALPGDDLAVVPMLPGVILCGCDQVLDGVHFRLHEAGPRAAGRKAMNRNLSDCAAMGALPVGALLSLALPRADAYALAREIYLGVEEAGARHHCPILGGDSATWDGPLAVSVTILARCDTHRPVARSGARPGDEILVTGPLGGSILGRHLLFEPRIEIGMELARRGAHAMMDISDGLAIDLHRLCRASGVGAEISAAQIPIHPDVSQLTVVPEKRLEHALFDGEDHELLACVEPGSGHGIGTVIGRVTSGGEVCLLGADGTRRALPPRGWEHLGERAE